MIDARTLQITGLLLDLVGVVLVASFWPSWRPRTAEDQSGMFYGDPEGVEITPDLGRPRLARFGWVLIWSGFAAQLAAMFVG